jgi:hypothetical protein
MPAASRTAILRSVLAIFSLALPCRAHAADCDLNGVDDREDIARGATEDCNQNGIPDRCETTPPSFNGRVSALPMPSPSRAVALADFDGDGLVDVLVGGKRARGGATLGLALQRSSLGFESPAAAYDAGEELQHLAAADLDGDGDVDVATAAAAAINVFRNHGNGSFGAAIGIALDGEARFVAAADLDGDRLPELVTTIQTLNSLVILRRRGGLERWEPEAIAVGQRPAGAALADLDGDGDTDIACLNLGSRSVSLFLNSGAGALSPGASLALAQATAVQIEAADVDGDQAPELLVRDAAGIAVFKNDGAGAFFSSAVLATPANHMVLADVDDDGDADLAALARPNLLQVFLNLGGAFGAPLSFRQTRAGRFLAAADLDGDGDADVVQVSNSVTHAELLWNDLPEGGLELAVTPVPISGCADARGCRPHGLALGDFNGDGGVDAIASNTHPGSFSVVLNNGAGVMAFRANHVFGGEHPQSVAAGDLDGDGDVDAVTVDNIDNNLYVHLNRGDATFLPPRRAPIGVAPIHVRLADLDGDGDLDAASANPGSNNVSVLFNNGAGVFAAGRARDLASGSGTHAVAPGDFDGDGDADLAAANPGGNSIAIFLNSGAGEFRLQGAAMPAGANNPNHVLERDLDGDGDLDLVTANTAAGSSSIFVNQGGALFEAPRVLPVGQSPYTVSAADLNADGVLDLVTANETQNSISALLGEGELRFARPYIIDAGIGLRNALPADLDGDGKPELVTNNREGDSLSIIQNRTRPPVGDALERVCTRIEFDEIAAQSGADAGIKYIAPAREDGALLPLLFQNTRRFALHEDFLRGAFPERFPALTPAAYTELTARRSSRQYFVGAIVRRRLAEGAVFGFNVVADFDDGREALAAEEVKALYERLAAVFRLRPFVYMPATRAARQAAQAWSDPGFPLLIDDSGPRARFIAYTQGIGFGRLRLLGPVDFEDLNREGRLGFQDILVLEEAPRDIEGVVGGVITAAPQGELSHLSVRTARRGTPNAYVEGAAARLAPFEGRLVRLEVAASDFSVREASIEEAQAGWEAARPRLSEAPRIDREHDGLDALDAMDLASEDPPPEARYGGKAANLARLRAILDGPFERYREDGFAVPMRHYLDFLRSNRLPSAFDDARQVTYEEHLAELFADERFQSDAGTRFAALAKLRRHMEDEGVVPSALARRIALRIAEVFGSTREMVRLRSSSNVEDAIEFNGAGLYESGSACAADLLDADERGPSRCDAASADERDIAETLKEVWASLWSYRAFEERAYYGIPQADVAMGVLVSRAFLDERANGVAFTGSPSDPLDRRYVITVQKGEASVVSPDPGVLAEKDLLSIENGEAAAIVRAQASTLMPAGQWVLSDDELRELGRVLARVDAAMPVELGEHPRERVVFDVEFKVSPDGAIALKQARPFLVSGTPPPAPSFQLLVPEGLWACGIFRYGRELDDEHALKSRLRFAAGVHALPSARGSFALRFIEELRFGPEDELAAPAGEGSARVERAPAAGGRTRFTFDLRQRFSVSGGRTLEIFVGPLEFEAAGDRPIDGLRAIDERVLTDEMPLQGLVSGAGAPAAISYAACDLELLPLWRVSADFPGGGIEIEERFRPEPFLESGPAAVALARVRLGADSRQVSDYRHLVYAAEKHNEHVSYRVVLEPPLSSAALPQPLRAIEVRGGEGAEASLALLGGDSVELAPPSPVTLRREQIAAAPAGRFRRGDADADGVIRIADAGALLQHLFRGGAAPPCLKAADADDSGRLNVGDAVAILQFLFKENDPLPEPLSRCGPDPIPDALDCAAYPPCDDS